MNSLAHSEMGFELGTVHGLECFVFPLFYHPDASPGPHDSHYLFEDFVKVMEESKSSSQ